MNIVGQHNLLNILNTYSIDDFPKASILLGEKGSGRHLISSYIAQHLGLNIVDVNDNLDLEYITNIYLNPINSLYIIDISYLTEKNQNIILKLLEEPPLNAYILILAEDKSNIIDTICNRCITFNMNKYSKEELSVFVKENDYKDLILDTFDTPGKILNVNTNNLKDINSLASNILDKISKANYSNTLTLVNKFNFKDNFDKYDFNLFINIFLKEIFNKWNVSKDKKLYNLYIETIKELNKLKDNRINTQLFVENYFTKVWSLMR